MVGLSCMLFTNTLSSVAERIYNCTRHSGVSLKKVPEQKKYLIKEYHRSDPIYCLAVIELACSVFS